MRPYFVSADPRIMTQKPYDIYTLVVDQMKSSTPDRDLPIESLLRDPHTAEVLVKMAAMIGAIAECLPRNEQVNLAETLGYKEWR